MKKVTDPTTGATVPWSDRLGLRMGPDAIFRGQAGNSNWFHFSIPTPAVTPDPENANHLGISIDRISLYFATPNEEVNIDSMILFDGGRARAIQQVGPAGRLLFDSHLDTYLEDTTSFVIDPAIVLPVAPGPHGVLLSVQVQFRAEGDVTFRCAGIHYAIG